MEKEKIVVREDLNEMVKNIGFKTIKNTKFGDRHVCIVTLFNGEEIEFKDSDGLYEICNSFIKCGLEVKDYIKSKVLVEELKKDENDEVVGKYVCVKYTLKTDDGYRDYRLFVAKFSSLIIIDNYYKLYKKQKLSTTSAK